MAVYTQKDLEAHLIRKGVHLGLIGRIIRRMPVDKAVTDTQLKKIIDSIENEISRDY